MLISHKHKFVFIEIEKTGSTSIRNMLENYFKKDVTIFTYPSRKFPLLHRHNTIKEAVESIPECKNYFKFSFVRNPWDREVSRFFWNIQKRDVLIKEINNLKIQSKSKIKNKQKQVEFFQKNFHIRNIQKEQSTYLCVGEEIAVDFVGKLEMIKQDFSYICEKISMPLPEILHDNKSDRDHYRGYYDIRCRDIAETYYARDIKNFYYNF